MIRSAKEKTVAAFAASLAVTLFTLPIIINTYYEIPIFSVLLNLLVVPLMGLVLGSGMFSALAGLLSLFFARLAVGAGVYLVTTIEWVCELMNRIPFSVVVSGHMSPLRVFLYYSLLALFLLMTLRTGVRKAYRNSQSVRLLLLAALVFLLALTIFAGRQSSELKITMFDVDQGESILVESPSGAVYLIDGGSSSVPEVYRYRLESALKYRGISKIDYVIISHPDTDHLSGILEMLEDRSAGSIRISHILTPALPANKNYQKLAEKAEAAEVPLASLRAGMILKEAQISFRCLHPDNQFHSEDTNDWSAVLELNYGSFRALFTGDISSEEEQLMLKRNALSDCDLLKVAHHGSRYSSCKAFLDRVAPETAVISAGVNNSYGHPNEETLKRLSFVCREISCTKDCGEIQVAVKASGKYSVAALLD